MTPVIEARGLTKTFRTRVKQPGLRGSIRSIFRPEYRKVGALRGIDLTVDRGEMVAFIGPNGAGKSTTIKILTGILYPSGGRASVLGHVPWEERQQLAYRIGTVFGQKSQLWYHLPPADSFRLLGDIYEVPPAAFARRRDFLVEMFEIGDLMEVPVRKLSLGQRIRCEVAGALIHSPDLVFLDEPTIGLDVVVKHRVRQLIQRLNHEDDVTILLTSHDAGDVEDLCHRALVINEGSIVVDRSVAALKDIVHRKRLEVRFAQPADLTGLQQVRVLEAGQFSVRLEVDTERTAIDEVIRTVMADNDVADVTIENPPMEEIISHLYRGGIDGGVEPEDAPSVQYEEGAAGHGGRPAGEGSVQ